MDNKNPLTPNKIQRLMFIAADKSFPTNRAPERKPQPEVQSQSMPESNCESSGILDLDCCEVFGDSGVVNFTLSKSTSFHPREMSGRSTGAEAFPPDLLAPTPTFTEYGRYSQKSLFEEMNQQTNEVQNILRTSIAPSCYSFHSKRDLTADEASLVYREAPVNPNLINMDLKESLCSINPVELSMGAYFQTRSEPVKNFLVEKNRQDHSDISLMPDSPSVQVKEYSIKESVNKYSVDSTLDCVPVRQPREVSKISEVKPVSPKESRIPPKLMSNLLKDPSKQHLHSLQRPDSVESINISTIQALLGDDGSINISEVMNTDLASYKKQIVKNPLSNIDINNEINIARLNLEQPVTYLKDTKKVETGSSTNSVNTVLDMSKVKASKIPIVVVEEASKDEIELRHELAKAENRGSCKSSSSKSHSTMSTVQENLTHSFKSNDSPLMLNKGEAKVTSPNIGYKELDKSVDWQEILQTRCQLKSEGIAKVSEEWVEIEPRPVEGFVGAPAQLEVTLKSLTDTWLTAGLDFKLTRETKDLSIDIPRTPFLLAPGKTEKYIIQIISNKEINTKITCTFCLKDPYIDGSVEKEVNIDIHFKLPSIQAYSQDKFNELHFPAVQEGKSLTKCFVLISDCPVDLQLELSISEGTNMFSISNVKEIMKSEITKKLLDSPSLEEDKRLKNKEFSKQLCRLSSGNAIKVALKFTAPLLEDLNLHEKVCTLKGSMNINLMGINTLLHKVPIHAIIGTAILKVVADKIHIDNEMAIISVNNVGSITGTWTLKLKSSENQCPFKLFTNKLQIEAGGLANLNIGYHGPADRVVQSTLIFEDVVSEKKVSIQITGGRDRPKIFPIRTNVNILSWVRNGRKELSLKNNTNKRLHLKCKVIGEGFYIDLPRTTGTNTVMLLTFGPCECRPLPIVFHGHPNQPCVAAVYLIYETDVELSRKVLLYGCASAESLMWKDVVTYGGGDTALVRAISRKPLDLQLINKAEVPVFLAATVHFNLRYLPVASSCYLINPHRIIPGKGRATLTLQLDWAKIEKRSREAATSSTLATVTIFTGAEITRRRILRTLRDGTNGQLNVSSVPDHLKLLAGPFDGEDAKIDNLLQDFHETKTSLDELLGGIQELTAQIDLPYDCTEDNTILITDDTVVEHHTLHE